MGQTGYSAVMQCREAKVEGSERAHGLEPAVQSPSDQHLGASPEDTPHASLSVVQEHNATYQP